jgi:hypothetical protein
MYVLKFTPEFKDGLGQWNKETAPAYYFCNLGLPMGVAYPGKRLIERTSPDRKEAREFATEEEANEILVLANHPKNWSVEPA